MSQTPTTCPDCASNGHRLSADSYFCRFCQQHYGANTNRPFPTDPNPEDPPMTAPSTRPRSSYRHSMSPEDNKFLAEVEERQRNEQQLVRILLCSFLLGMGGVVAATTLVWLAQRLF